MAVTSDGMRGDNASSNDLSATVRTFASSNHLSLPVMTFNLHRDNGIDGANSWERRRDICVSVIKKFSPAVICTQQGLKSQLDELVAALPGYWQFGMSRKGSLDPCEEHTAILYNRDRVEKMDGGTFWLSKTPEVPDSKSWGADTPSIATWVTFQLKGVHQPGFAFQIVSTHLDRKSSRARRNGAILIWQHIATLPPGLPVIFCGSFNTVKESTPGRFLLGKTRKSGVVGELRDGWVTARKRCNSSVIYTSHGFKGERRGAKAILKLVFMGFCLCWDPVNQDAHTDWILFRGRALSPVYSEVVIDNVNGQYPSDHYPVFLEFSLPRTVTRVEEELN